MLINICNASSPSIQPQVVLFPPMVPQQQSPRYMILPYRSRSRVQGYCSVEEGIVRGQRSIITIMLERFQRRKKDPQVLRTSNFLLIPVIDGKFKLVSPQSILLGISLLTQLGISLLTHSISSLSRVGYDFHVQIICFYRSNTTAIEKTLLLRVGPVRLKYRMNKRFPGQPAQRSL